MTTRSIMLCLLLAGVSIFQTACGGATMRRVPEGTWPWLPVEVDFHRLSRFEDHDGREILSLRVEFSDAEGDPVKFAGTVIFRLVPDNTLNESWTFSYDLSNLKTNAEHWGHVASMYEFGLEVGWDDPPLMNTPIRVKVSADSSSTGLLESGVTVRRGN